MQVKGGELDQLWTVSKLCQREGRKIGTSILERSLAYDRHMKEQCSFRIVSARDIKNELKILTYPLASKHRISSTNDSNRLEREVIGRIGNYTSPAGNDCAFWLSKALWEIRHSIESVKNANLQALRSIVEKHDEYLVSDQLEELYNKLLGGVQGAATIDCRTCPNAKRIPRKDLRHWFGVALEDCIHPAAKGSGKAIEQKTRSANVPDDTIQCTQELRKKYRAEALWPRYLELADG